MPVKIRLSRVGKKHAPFYRIVSVDSRKKRDGAFLEDLGTYDTLNSVIVRFDEEGYKQRLSQGAIATDSVKKIYLMFKKGLTEEAFRAQKAKETVALKAAPKKAKAEKAPVKAESKKEAAASEPAGQASKAEEKTTEKTAEKSE